MAPAMVLKEGEVPDSGWLVEGSLDLVDSGHPGTRAEPLNLWGDGASHIVIHVRIIDLDHRSGVTAGGKDVTGGKEVQTEAANYGQGNVIYEFDVAGGSHETGKFGSVTAPGLGYAVTFDYRNAAERIYEALDTDEFSYGLRDSPTIR